MAKDKHIPEDLKEAIRASTQDFARMMTTPMTESKVRYMQELVAVTRAAAIGGDYVPAIKGYELIGKVLNHLVENHQHTVTVHGNHLSEATDAELVEILRTPLLPPPKTPEALSAPSAPGTPAAKAQAEAEALLYA
jgi:hypothetical protein